MHQTDRVLSDVPACGTPDWAVYETRGINKRYTMADTASVPWRLFVKKFVGQFESKIFGSY
jgi:hypothetical protein